MRPAKACGAGRLLGERLEIRKSDGIAITKLEVCVHGTATRAEMLPCGRVSLTVLVDASDCFGIAYGDA